MSIDASKRRRDERLNEVMNQFDSKDKYSDKKKLLNIESNYKDEFDDEEDIITMMDKMN